MSTKSGLILRVLVRGFRWNTTQNDLRAYFKEFGTIFRVDLTYNLQTGYPRTLAFLDIKVKNSVEEERLKFTKHQVGDRFVNIKCERRDSRQKEAGVQGTP